MDESAAPTTQPSGYPDSLSMEIFNLDGYAGDWPRTEADLQQIATNYDPQYVEAPVGLGHDDKTGPAHGWVSGVRCEGRRLFADVRQVSRDLVDLLRAGRYKKRSCELYSPDHPKVKMRGLSGGYLAGLAFLGRQQPAVAGMADVRLSEEPPHVVVCVSEAELLFEEHTSNLYTKEQTMDGSRGKDATDDIVRKYEDLHALMEERREEYAEKDRGYQEMSERVTDLEKQVREYEEREAAREQSDRESRRDEWLKSLEESGRIAPAQRGGLRAALLALSDDVAEALVQALQSGPVVVDLSEHDHDPAPPVGDAMDGDALDARIREYQSKHAGASYAESMLAIAKNR